MPEKVTIKMTVEKARKIKQEWQEGRSPNYIYRKFENKQGSKSSAISLIQAAADKLGEYWY